MLYVAFEYFNFSTLRKTSIIKPRQTPRSLIKIKCTPTALKVHGQIFAPLKATAFLQVFSLVIGDKAGNYSM